MKINYEKLSKWENMTGEEKWEHYLENMDEIEEWWESKKNKHYGELFTEWDEMDTDESWEDFISRHPLPEDK